MFDQIIDMLRTERVKCQIHAQVNILIDKLRKTAADFQCYSFLDASLVIQQNENIFCHNIL